jgi:hypothetical protein
MSLSETRRLGMDVGLPFVSLEVSEQANSESTFKRRNEF